jgi:hypothetical protein
MDTGQLHRNAAETAKEPTPAINIGEGIAENAAAWERLANGRYMPRRVRGSCHGRELG